MKRTLTIALILSLTLIFSGCKLVDTAKETYSALMDKFTSDTLPTKDIVLKTQAANINMTVEVADDEGEREQGLMERDVLEEGKGMLFVFPDEAPRQFWMKNTKIPLDVIFFNSKREVVYVVEGMSPCNVTQCPSYSSLQPAMFALEVPAGWTATRKVGLGDSFDYL